MYKNQNDSFGSYLNIESVKMTTIRTAIFIITIGIFFLAIKLKNTSEGRAFKLVPRWCVKD